MINKIIQLLFICLIVSTSVSNAGVLDSDKKFNGRNFYDKKEGKPKIFIEGIYLDLDLK